MGRSLKKGPYVDLKLVKKVHKLSESGKNSPIQTLEERLIMVKSINLPIKGVSGQLKIKGIFVIYVSSFFVWLNDETIALDKTMTALDKYLDQANNILKFINK